MAMHEIPAAEAGEHLVDRDGWCPCSPARIAGGRHDGTIGTLLLHAEFDPDLDDDGPDHAIPDDHAPHARTSECGCGPQLGNRFGRTVYIHVDQAAGDNR